MDAADTPRRVTTRRIHKRPRHTTDLAVAQRTCHTGTGNTSGARQFLRFIHLRVGCLPAGHANLIGGKRGSESGVDDQS